MLLILDLSLELTIPSLLGDLPLVLRLVDPVVNGGVLQAVPAAHQGDVSHLLNFPQYLLNKFGWIALHNRPFLLVPFTRLVVTRKVSKLYQGLEGNDAR